MQRAGESGPATWRTRASRWSTGRPEEVIPWIVVGIVAMVLGGLVVIQPVVAVFGAILCLAVSAIAAASGRISSVFVACLSILLVGYALLGRGLAHVGAPPLYLGELMLPLAILAIGASWRRFRISAVTGLLLGFMVLGFFRTVPYLGLYGIDALRDAVIWGYAIYAIAIWLALEPRHIPKLVRWYAWIIPVFLVAFPIVGALWYSVGDGLPHGPGSDLPILTFKPGDVGVHLAGIAAFLLLGLYPVVGPIRVFVESILWLLWLAVAAMVAALTRGGIAAAATAALVPIFMRSSARWASAILVAVSLFAALMLINPVVDLGTARKVSATQLVENVISVLADDNNSNLQDSKSWRLAWWDTIIGYTIGGPYTWTGKGFGINLANDDGFQVLEDASLRSPHSAHLTILARMGLPGLILWISLQLAFAAAVLRSARLAKRAGLDRWVMVHGWVFIYWLAALVNMSFDVYLEGPQGGIWFWALIGLGLALVRMTPTVVEQGDVGWPVAEPSTTPAGPAAPSPAASTSASRPLPQGR